MLKHDVLYALEQNKGTLVTGGALASRFDVTRAAIWKAVRALIEEGNLITAYPNAGYMLSPESDGLNIKSISAGLKTSFMGREVCVLKTVVSTNQFLRERDFTAMADGYTVVADEQTAGRGRSGRAFLSPAGQGVYMSIFLKPNIAPAQTQFLTLCAAVAVARAVEATAGLSAQIKWVNDVYIGGKKLSGILTEATISAEAQVVDSAIIGIGINTGAVPEDLADIATSLREAGCASGIRNALIPEVLNQFESLYLGYTSNLDTTPVIAAYTERLLYLNETVAVLCGEQKMRGGIEGVSDSGALLLRTANGVIPIISGEILKSDL